MPYTEVLLINAKSWQGQPPSYLPYGILWIAGLLRNNGFSVALLDRNVDNRSLSEVMAKENPKIVGISCLTGPVINDAINISKIIKERHKDVTLVWGGIHPTIFPRHVLVQPYVDYVISGEGEFPLLELARYLRYGEGKLEQIKNLGYKLGKELILNENRDFIDLNILPNPGWDLVDIKKYIQKKFYSNKVITLNTSRGCPWRCAFCYNQAVNHRRWRGISAEKVVEHMEYLESNYGIRGFQFYDDEFDVDEKRVLKMCDILIKKKKRYSFGHFSRVNHIKTERLRKEKEAGLRFIEFGIESGSDRMLEFIEKDQTVEMTKNAFTICRNAGVKSGALFMLGLPDESEAEVIETKDLADSLGAHQTIATIFKPYPATRLYDYCVSKNLFKLPDNLEEQGRIYSLGDFSLNVSRVRIDVLRSIYNHFALKSVINEIINCLAVGNFSLIFYYLKHRLGRFGTLFRQVLNLK
ncbi:MAG: radical SAM protein [bacterium]